MLTAYHDRFLAQFGAKPLIEGGKDGAIVKGLLASHGLDMVLAMLERFFDSQDDFIARSGHTVGVFRSVFNKLIVQERPRASLSPRMQRNVDNARAAILKGDHDEFPDRVHGRATDPPRLPPPRNG